MKRLVLSIFALLSLPLYSMANNSIAKASGVSDIVLMIILISIIVLLLGVAYALAKSIEGVSKLPRNEKAAQRDKHIPKARILIAFLLSSSTFQLSAAEVNASKAAPFVMTNTTFYVLICTIVFLALIISILFYALQTLVRVKNGESFEVETPTEGVLKQLNLTDNVPIEREVEIMLDHEYDGIRELDNNLPPWWKYMFYATIIFAFVYIIRFHITGDGQLQDEEYVAEMNEAAEEKAVMMANAAETITEENVVYLIDAPTLAKGAAIYKGNCATCHGQLGEGGAGPNLTDEYWIHGGNINSVFKTIKYGVPAKGMIAWQSQFSPSQMQTIASYVLSLKGSNPPNGKAPQGEIYVEELISDEGDIVTVVVELEE